VTFSNPSVLSGFIYPHPTAEDFYSAKSDGHSLFIRK
jgi:hypothetical protein